jgi:hypothetical protein
MVYYYLLRSFNIMQLPFVLMKAISLSITKRKSLISSSSLVRQHLAISYFNIAEIDSLALLHLIHVSLWGL